MHIHFNNIYILILNTIDMLVIIFKETISELGIYFNFIDFSLYLFIMFGLNVPKFGKKIKYLFYYNYYLLDKKSKYKNGYVSGGGSWSIVSSVLGQCII